MHPRLDDLLTRHDLTPDDFYRKGRLPPGKQDVLAKRRALVTELHQAGTSWADMLAITGLSQGSIQRLTGAMWNDASRKNVSRVVAEQNQTRKGQEKPWLSEQMRQSWDEGKFDFHFGRPRSDEEIAKWKAAKHGRRGRTEWMDTQKGGRILTRSALERLAAARLDADPQVRSFEYERPIRVGARTIFPDFIVLYVDGHTTLVEIKPSFVFRLKDAEKTEQRLEMAREVARQNGWDFTLWTENELAPSTHRKRKKPPAVQLPLEDPQDSLR